jgi:capsular exopolysaccharide synthesis family protein
MSQIFDALRQSESDRSGTQVSVARELLEAAESHKNVDQVPIRSERPVVIPHRDQLASFKTVPVKLSPDNKFVSITDTDSLAAEKFRFLGIRLRYLQQKKPMKSLLVTSSVPGEGKSTVAGNLACALAASKLQKVLLLEGDLRRPSLAHQLGLENYPGLCESLESSPEEATNIYRLEELGLWVLPAGGSPRNPLEFLQPAKVSVLVDRLTSFFDWIIIDSPPILPLADTIIWMRLADAVLLVTRPGTTAKRQLHRSLEAVEQSKLLGAVLNGSREAVPNSYYYYTARPAAAHSVAPPSS